MKDKFVIRLNKFVIFNLLILPVSAIAGTGELQIIYTSLIDIDSMISKTICICKKQSPATTNEIEKAYKYFKSVHLPYQNNIRQIVLKELENTDLKNLIPKSESDKKLFETEIAEKFLPQEALNGDSLKSYCKDRLPGYLKGEGLMIKFKEYAEEVDRLGTLKIFKK